MMSVPTPPPDTGPDFERPSKRNRSRDAAQQAPPSAAADPPGDPPDDPPAPESRGDTRGSVVRRRRRKRRKKTGYSGIVAALTVLALAGIGVGTGFVYLLNHRTAQAAKTSGDMLAGYIADRAVLEHEYRLYYGKPVENHAPEQFQRAGEMVRTHSFAEAADVLEAVAKQAAVPAVYNDLGVLYAKLNDLAHAGTAFREALARDPKYAAVLANLKRLKGFTADATAPVTREVEPNNNRFAANLIAVGTPVEGEIAAGSGDVDFFRFSFPAAPRDVLAVQLTNFDFRFSPRLDIYDSDMRILDWGRKTAAPGSSLTTYGSTAPNATIYLAVSATDGSSGRYILSLKSMRAFDEYEPDDDIFHAHKIEPQSSPDGRLQYAPLKANIMDRDDTDFYSFVAAAAGTVTVEVHNESVTLIPAVQFYGPDMRSMGFGPTVRNPGENLRATLEVQNGQTYYVQIWAQANTSGAYTLTVH